MKSVTNILFGLSRLSSSFTWVRMLAVDGSSVARDLISVLVTAMNKAAGTPFPDTSPMQKHNLSSSMKKKSKKSPPISRAGSSDPYIENSLRSGKGGKVSGTMLI